jgi:transcription antitermination factor NusG
MVELQTTAPPVCASQDAPAWYAIRTRSRHEKRVAALLREKRITTFLPLVKEVHRWSDRRKLIEQPLFRGYVFVHIRNTAERTLSVLRTPGVAGFVGVQGTATPIPDQEIYNIRTLLSGNLPFSVFPFLHAGQRVRIRGGCLHGVEGRLVEVNSNRSVVVSVELIRKSVVIRVSGFDLEII